MDIKIGVFEAADYVGVVVLGNSQITIFCDPRSLLNPVDPVINRVP